MEEHDLDYGTKSYRLSGGEIGRWTLTIRDREPHQDSVIVRTTLPEPVWKWVTESLADSGAQAQAIAEVCALSQQDVQTVLDAVLESRAKDRLLDKLLRTVRLASDEFCFWDDYGHQWVLDEGERAVAKALRPNPSVTYPTPP